MTNTRADAAAERFNNNGDLEVLFATSDNECFTVETTAAAHQEDLTGERDGYKTITPDHVALYDDLNGKDTTADCDTALEDSELEDAFSQELTDAKKAEIVETDRVTEKLDFVGELSVPADTALLNMLLHGEENEDVIAAINVILND